MSFTITARGCRTRLWRLTWVWLVLLLAGGTSAAPQTTAPAVAAEGRFVAGPNPYPAYLSDAQHVELGRLSYWLFRRDFRRAEEWLATRDDLVGDLGRVALYVSRSQEGTEATAEEWRALVERLRSHRGAGADAWATTLNGYAWWIEGWRASKTGSRWRSWWAYRRARSSFLKVKEADRDLSEADLGIALLLHDSRPDQARRFIDHAATHSVYVAPLADVVRVAWARDAGETALPITVGQRYDLTVLRSPYLLEWVGDAHMDAGNYRTAAQWYQRLAFERRREGWPLLRLAQARAALAEVERGPFWQRRTRDMARRDFLSYLSSADPDRARHAAAYVALAEIERRDGDTEAAKRYYRLALGQVADYPPARKALERLGSADDTDGRR
jgi:tetratricopeptide (TPR) repeat protein